MYISNLRTHRRQNSKTCDTHTWQLHYAACKQASYGAILSRHLTHNAPSLECLGDDAARLVFHLCSIMERSTQCLHIVTIHTICVPPADMKQVVLCISVMYFIVVSHTRMKA